MPQHTRKERLKSRAAKAKRATDRAAPIVPGGLPVRTRRRKMEDRIKNIFK